jgi:hypothetical protein
MKTFERTIAFLAVLALARQYPAVCAGGDLLHGVAVPSFFCKHCCDDYCPKPLPHVGGMKNFCCDDYCAKPHPCPACVKAFCCDDYCPKCPPRIFCPPNTNLKCPPNHSTTR